MKAEYVALGRCLQECLWIASYQMTLGSAASRPFTTVDGPDPINIFGYDWPAQAGCPTNVAEQSFD